MKIPKPNRESGMELIGALICILALGLIGGCAVAVIRDIRNNAHPRVIATDDGDADGSTNTIEFPLIPPLPSSWAMVSASPTADPTNYNLCPPLLVLISMDTDQVVTLSISLAPTSGTFMDPLNLAAATGLVGVPITLEWSGDLQTWSAVATFPVQAGQPVQFTDYLAPAGRGFYRTKR